MAQSRAGRTPYTGTRSGTKAAQYRMQPRGIHDLYVFEETAIWSWDAWVAMVSGYRAPSRVPIEVLKEATFAEHQPRSTAKVRG